MPNSRSRRMAADQTGAVAIEYSLVAALIAIALIGVMIALGGEVNTTYDTVETEYAGANAGAGAPETD